jgi:hypothetical protein
MTEDSRYEAELMDLLGAIWDDRADEQTYARLEKLVTQKDGSGVRLLERFSRLHLDLEHFVSSESARKKLVEILPQAEVIPKFRSVKQRRLLTGILGIAASLAVLSMAYWQFGFSRVAPPQVVAPQGGIHEIALVRSPLEVARVAWLEDAVWGGDQTKPLVGRPLMEGQVLQLQQGKAQISMGLGADVVMHAPSRVTLLSDSLVRLEEGAVAVQAAEWATGFSVETSNGLRITDLGTRFLVNSEPNGVSEARVLEGSVLAKSLNEAAPSRPDLLIGTHRMARLTRSGVISELDSMNHEKIDEFEHFQPLRPIEIWNTGVGLQLGEKDTNWTITAGDETVGPFPQPSTVCPPFQIYRDNEPGISQWISVDQGTTFKGVPAWTNYVFETTFDLTGFDPNSVRISARVLADNGVREVRLNGKVLPVEPWNDYYVGVTYYEFHRFEIEDGFVPGVNKIQFLVNNDTYISKTDQGVERPNTPNPMGLRVEWRAYGRPNDENGSIDRAETDLGI